MNISYILSKKLINNLILKKKFYTKLSIQNIVNNAPKKIQPYFKLMRIDKPIGTWLLYYPCTWSIAISTPANSLPDFYLLGLFGTGAFLMRGAGCVINDLWDKDFDRKVERTKLRPLASGELNEKEAIIFLAGLLSVSLSILLQLNWLSVFVGASSLILVILYPLTKRYTYWPQIILGCTFNWGTLLGYTAVTNSFNPFICLPLYISGLCWTLIYDTIYAHQDKADDLIIGIKSTALKFQESTKVWLTGFSTIMLSNLAYVGYITHQIWPYYLALGGAATHLTWQIKTVDINNREECWSKFKSNQNLGVIIFLGIVLSNLFKKKNLPSTEEINQKENF